MRDSKARADYNCVDIGAGPADLSLASLLHSHPEVSNFSPDELSTVFGTDMSSISGFGPTAGTSIELGVDFFHAGGALESADA